MHVTPSELRILRQDGIQIRFALLGELAYVHAEVPATGSDGTSLETPCTRPHWGFVLDGEVAVEVDGRTRPIPPGSAFHIPPGGPEHRFRVVGAARVAGFEPIDPTLDTSDAGLSARGFVVAASESSGTTSTSVVLPVGRPVLDPTKIEARTWPMSTYVLTEARFGPGSGYLNDWCDVPHWGLVTVGRLAMEWEDDVEILAAGDIYHCPAGPPGHRLEAADPAAVVDLTPIAALATGGRLAPWRASTGNVGAKVEAREGVAVAGLG